MKQIRLILIALILSSTPALAQKVEQKNAASIVENSANSEAFWSITVRNEDGTILEEHNSNKLITPASNLKLYTTAATLDRLGPDYKFTTNVYGIGELKDSVWVGDLVIKGSGDPTISGVLYSEDREYVFKSYLNQLKNNGINGLEGRLLADISFFDDDPYPVGWDWYDMSFYYSVQINALSFNNNTFDLEVFAEGEVGDKPRIDWYPKIKSIVLHNNQTIVEADKKYDEYYRKRMGYNEYDLGSFLPVGYYEDEALAIEKADAFFLESFELFLNENNFKINEQDFENARTILDGNRNAAALASHISKPLSVMVERINKESDNFYTEMILKTLGAEKQSNPGTFKNGIWEVKKFLSEQAIDTNDVVMYDGSGLSSSDKTTTRDFSLLMHTMKSHPHFDIFYESLPIAAVDGSLEHRFKNTLLENNLRAKTGFINGVRTLTGYMKTKSDNFISFSIATNNFKGFISPLDNTHQKVLLYLYDKY